MKVLYFKESITFQSKYRIYIKESIIFRVPVKVLLFIIAELFSSFNKSGFLMSKQK